MSFQYIVGLVRFLDVSISRGGTNFLWLVVKVGLIVTEFVWLVLFFPGFVVFRRWLFGLELLLCVKVFACVVFLLVKAIRLFSVKLLRLLVVIVGFKRAQRVLLSVFPSLVSFTRTGSRSGHFIVTHLLLCAFTLFTFLSRSIDTLFWKLVLSSLAPFPFPWVKKIRYETTHFNQFRGRRPKARQTSDSAPRKTHLDTTITGTKTIALFTSLLTHYYRESASRLRKKKIKGVGDVPHALLTCFRFFTGPSSSLLRGIFRRGNARAVFQQLMQERGDENGWN